MAYYWTRILLRLPASGADKAAVLAECAKLPADFGTLHDVCAAMAASPMDYNQSHKVFTDELPSVAHHNLMFASDGKRWSDTTDRWKAGYGGWSWNAKFADVDNAGWQDLFIVQGTRLRLYNPSNVLYRNRGGERLEEVPGRRDSRTTCRRLPRCSSIWMRTVTSTSSPSRSSSPPCSGGTRSLPGQASRFGSTTSAPPIASGWVPGCRSARRTVGSRSAR
jgi:hypothetical protein